MHNLYIKKTVMVFASLMMVVSLLAFPGTSNVNAEGGKLFSLPIIAANMAVTDTVIFDGHASWKFFDKGSLPAADWMRPGFNDSGWAAGPARLGYGNGDEATVVSYGSNPDDKYITTYFRKPFNITSAASVAGLKMNMVIDDGSVVYLNGVEVARTNMPTGAVGYSTLAISALEESKSLAIDPKLLVNGTNTLAVEVHQSGNTSSDIVFELALTASVDTTPPTAVPTNPPTAAPTSQPTAVPTSQPTTASASGPNFGKNAEWKYLVKDAIPGVGWPMTAYNDDGWPTGAAPLGYGKGTEQTVIGYGPDAANKYITTYFRKKISVDNAAAITALRLNFEYDNGLVVYLNGREVARGNLPTGTISHSTLASRCITENKTVDIDPRLLVNGVNTLAVDVHNCDKGSRDLGFWMTLVTSVGSGFPPPPTAQPTSVPTTNPTAVPTTVPTSAPTQPPPTGSNVFYVSPSGSSSGSGSQSSPWSLQAALDQPSAVKPGAIIYLRGGTYKGAYSSALKGSSSAPITVRAYPGERAIIVNSTSPGLELDSTYYVNFWGLEISGPNQTRSITRNPSAYGIRVNQGTSSHHIKFINIIVHDVLSQGIGWWQALKDAEIYGSLFYFNGTQHFDHGVYAHNVSGNKFFINNMVFDNASYGFHGYAETTEKGLNNFTLEGNTLFNNGSIGYTETKGEYGILKRNILMGGLIRANNNTITNNYTYYPGSSGTALNLGYKGGSSSSTVTNNYFMGGNMELGGTNSGLTMTGNTVYTPGGRLGFSTSSYSNNSWLSSKPTGLKYFVRPNKYEPNRANLTIYNWDKKTSIVIPASALSGVAMKAGQQYELHNAQNYFGDIVTGVYDGSNLVVPMSNHSVAQPIGLRFKPASTFPEFGAFILIAK